MVNPGPTINLFEFQEKAVTNLINLTTKTDAKETIVMKAPTGSGKTIILIDYIDTYLSNVDKKTAFIWLCPGKGNLEEQSREKMIKLSPGRSTQNLFDALLGGFAEESTTFINWELVTKSGNIAIRDSERKNLFDRIAEAHRKGTEFIVIIDEEHSNFVGHPLVDIVHPSMTKDDAMDYFGARPEAKRVLLMPGSRKQEVLSLLDVMLETGERLLQSHEDVQFFLPRAHTIDRSELEAFIEERNVPVTITEDHTYDLMQICDVCLAASGTATLETAMMELPTVLLYKVSPITYGIGKMVVNLTHVGLPNIVAGKEVIPELLQGDVSVDAIVDTVLPLLDDLQVNQHMRSELRGVKEKLGESGAVNRVAQLIYDLGKEKTNE